MQAEEVGLQSAIFSFREIAKWSSDPRVRTEARKAIERLEAIQSAAQSALVDSDDATDHDMDLRQWREMEGRALCGCCGWEYLHPVRVEVSRGDDTIIVTRDGIERREEKNISRGVWIGIDFVCESHDSSRLSFQFHKGMTYVNTRSLGDVDDAKTIWRD